MKQIKSLKELKRAASKKEKDGEYIDFFICLNGGAKSFKRILYWPDIKIFNVINGIDDSTQFGMTEKQLGNRTIIVEAIAKGALYRY